MTSEKLFATTIVGLMLLTVSIAGSRRATEAAVEKGSGANLQRAPRSAQHQPAKASELLHNRPQGSRTAASVAESGGDLTSPRPTDEARPATISQSSPSRRPSPFRSSRRSAADTQGKAPTQPAALRPSPAQRSASAGDRTLKRSAAPQKMSNSLPRVGGEPNLAAQIQDRQLHSFSDDSAAQDARWVGIARIGGNIGRMAEVVGTEGAIAMLGGNVGRVAVLGGSLGAQATPGGNRGTPATVYRALPG